MLNQQQEAASAAADAAAPAPSANGILSCRIISDSSSARLVQWLQHVLEVQWQTAVALPTQALS